MLDVWALSEKTFPSFFRLTFWPSGAYFSGCPFLGELEQIRASAWQSEGLIVIPVVCKAPEGDYGHFMLGLGLGSTGSGCMCVSRVCSVCALCHAGLLLKAMWRKKKNCRECLLILTWLLPLGIRWMNKEVFVSASWSSALQQEGWILCWGRLRGMRLFSCNCQVSSKIKLLTRNTKCRRSCT